MAGDGTTRPDVGPYGVFVRGAPSIEKAQSIERCGYGTLWVAGSPPAQLDWAEPLLEATTSLVLATGIVNIWTAPPTTVAASFQRIENAFPGRFLLGIGAGHPELHQEYRKPLVALSEYLDILDDHDVPAARRVIGAQGPRALRLAADRSAGAHPYLTTPEHSAQARELLGAGPLLAPEHKVLLTADAARAREVGRRAFETSIQKTNYRTNWKRLGFDDVDFADGGSDRLVDAVVAHGTPERVAARLQEFHDAGADHVAVQILEPDEHSEDLAALSDLADALGLTPQRRK